MGHKSDLFREAAVPLAEEGRMRKLPERKLATQACAQQAAAASGNTRGCRLRSAGGCAERPVPTTRRCSTQGAVGPSTVATGWTRLTAPGGA
eukprot:351302-Chlamydomonas_euryale.AAC.5